MTMAETGPITRPYCLGRSLDAIDDEEVLSIALAITEDVTYMALLNSYILSYLTDGLDNTDLLSLRNALSRILNFEFLIEKEAQGDVEAFAMAKLEAADELDASKTSKYPYTLGRQLDDLSDDQVSELAKIILRDEVFCSELDGEVVKGLQSKVIGAVFGSLVDIRKLEKTIKQEHGGDLEAYITAKHGDDPLANDQPLTRTQAKQVLTDTAEQQLLHDTELSMFLVKAQRYASMAIKWPAKIKAGLDNRTSIKAIRDAISAAERHIAEL